MIHLQFFRHYLITDCFNLLLIKYRFKINPNLHVIFKILLINFDFILIRLYFTDLNIYSISIFHLIIIIFLINFL